MERIRRLKPSARLSLVLLGLLSGVLMIAPATAAPVAFSFTGVVTNVQPSLNPPFTTATLLTGSYTFEDSTGDSRPGYSNRGLYYGAITALDVHLGLYTTTLGNSGTNFIDMRNLSVDQYDLQAPLFGSPVVPPGNLTTLTAVPLPAAVILFGAGLVALVGLGAGSWRQKKNSLA